MNCFQYQNNGLIIKPGNEIDGHRMIVDERCFMDYKRYGLFCASHECPGGILLNKGAFPLFDFNKRFINFEFQPGKTKTKI